MTLFTTTQLLAQKLAPRIGTVTNKQTELSLIRGKTEWEVGSDRERGLERVFALVSVFRAHGWHGWKKKIGGKSSRVNLKAAK